MTSCASAPNCDYVLHAFRRRLSPSPLPPAPAPLNVGGVQYTPNILMCVGVCVFWLVICIISRLQRVVRIVCARWSAVNPVPSPKSKHATDRTGNGGAFSVLLPHGCACLCLSAGAIGPNARSSRKYNDLHELFLDT